MAVFCMHTIHFLSEVLIKIKISNALKNRKTNMLLSKEPLCTPISLTISFRNFRIC